MTNPLFTTAVDIEKDNDDDVLVYIKKYQKRE